MKKFIISVILGLLLCTTKTLAQQVNTLYFFDNVPYTSYINPALQTERDVYVGLPVLGWGQVSIGNLPFSVKDVIYKKNGQLVTFLHPELGNKDKFYKKIRNSQIGADYQINLLSFGWRKKNNYYSVGITERIDGGISLPKDIFQLLLYGTAESYDKGRVFNLKSLGASASVYTEIGVGVSTKLNEKLNIGYRIKFLLGTANLSFSPKKLSLSASTDEWKITGDASLKTSSFLKINNDFGIEVPSSVLDYIKPSGYGAAFDLGVTYDIIKDLKFSAAITDLGFIYWNRNVKNVDAEIDFAFDGVEVEGTSLFDDLPIEQVGEEALNGLTNDLNIGGEQEKNHYFSMPTAKLNIGLEYRFCKQKLGIGLLSRTMLYNKRLYEELTASFNMRPANWFNFSISYSMLNGRGSLGTALSLRGGPFLFFLAADYIPVSWTSYTSYGENNQPQMKIPIPYDYTGFNLSGGIVLVFSGRDSDKDGVKNKFDLCPKTPKGVKVDSVGCPLDTDGDGVPDYLDMCPETPEAAYGKIDSLGCPLDTDGDGVPDYLDMCPETPEAAYGKIDSLGCPLDTDGDGVPDYLDMCPETPEAAYGKIDSLGCPLDTDKDGVFDYIDQCPSTPEGVVVDSVGCPLDTDGDGVPDYLDKCPDTPKEAIGFVNAEGCPIDTDEDTVFDYLDKCPDVKGVASNNGCPEVNQEVLKLFTKALQGIQFDSGKSTIKKTSNAIMNEIVKVMEENPEYNLSIAGHTDNVGDPLKNLKLSDDRANAVRLFLIRAGIASERISAVGYGDTQPVADNSTAAGRKENRRVELSVSFEKLVVEKKETE